MPHELDKLDKFLGVEYGTSYTTVILHLNPTILNTYLNKYGISLDQYGMVPREQKNAWKKLMQLASISPKYWKDDDWYKLPDVQIGELNARHDT